MHSTRTSIGKKQCHYTEEPTPPTTQSFSKNQASTRTKVRYQRAKGVSIYLRRGQSPHAFATGRSGCTHFALAMSTRAAQSPTRSEQSFASGFTGCGTASTACWLALARTLRCATCHFCNHHRHTSIVSCRVYPSRSPLALGGTHRHVLVLHRRAHPRRTTRPHATSSNKTRNAKRTRVYTYVGTNHGRGHHRRRRHHHHRE